MCLSGIPGAGKTTLAAQIAADREPLREALGIDVAPRVTHICYDELMRARAAASGGGDAAGFDVGAWRASRADAAARARAALLAAGTTGDCPSTAVCVRPLSPALVLLDDNAHYRSMRKQAFHLARECGAAFVHVHVDAPLPLALARNAARDPAERVPEPLLLEMAESYERARASACGWERTTLTVSTDAHGAGARWTAVLEPAALVREWCERQLDEDDAIAEAAARDDAHRAASRTVTLASVTHRLDIRSRQVVARCLDARRDAPADEKRALAARLNAARRALLARARETAVANAAELDADAAELLVDEASAAFALDCRAALPAEREAQPTGCSAADDADESRRS